MTTVHVTLKGVNSADPEVLLPLFVLGGIVLLGHEATKAVEAE